MGAAFIGLPDEFVFQTDDNTPTVARSYPIGEEKVAIFEAKACCHEIQMTTGAAAKFVATFFRRTGGNVTKIGFTDVDLLVNTFPSPIPSLAFVANTQTQCVDVVLTGRTGESLRWHVRVLPEQTA